MSFCQLDTESWKRALDAGIDLGISKPEVMGVNVNAARVGEHRNRQISKLQLCEEREEVMTKLRKNLDNV